MKRLHVHIGVNDLAASINFYSVMFGAQPTVQKPDYAKWMLDEPRVNFAISQGRETGNAGGVSHLGVQVETPEELAEVSARIAAAGRPVLDEGVTTCCYARSEKSWISDPDGVAWEAFLTFGDSTDYGTAAALGSLAAPAAALAPAVPVPAASGCC